MKTAFYFNSIGILKFIYFNNKIYKIEKIDYIDGHNHRSLLTDRVNKDISEYLEAKRSKFFIYNNLYLKGTEFQLKVWKELQNIPYGETRTYKEIAQAIGKPKAIRAVASAIGKNPIMIIIPCHRVIGSDGKLHGYAYGLDLKKKLLNIENSNFL